MIVKIKPGKLAKSLDMRSKAVRRAIGQATIMAAVRAKAHIVRKTPTDQGQLKASWYVDPESAMSAMPARLINDAPHAGIVEEGARPHTTSQEGWNAIYEWVRRHFLFSTKVRSGKRKGQWGKAKQLGGDTGEDPILAEITWGIVKKIERDGQEPTWFVRNEMKAMQRFATIEVNKALKKLSQTKDPR